LKHRRLRVAVVAEARDKLHHTGSQRARRLGPRPRRRHTTTNVPVTRFSDCKSPGNNIYTPCRKTTRNCGNCDILQPGMLTILVKNCQYQLTILLTESIASTNTNSFVTILLFVFTFSKVHFFRGHPLIKLIK